MPALLLLGLVGFGAQLINSALGMGYGVSSTTALLALGTTPALAAATVNLSQVGSQLVAGLAHWRLGNVDWPVVRRIALPGAAGGFTGATVLSWLATDVARPLMAAILVGLGAYLLVRFTLRGPRPVRADAPLRARFLTPLGLVGGFLNSTGGGGWGPVGTTALLASGRLEPRKVIGSISAAELAVVLAGSAGFLLGLGVTGVDLGWVVVLLAGGVLAAPAAAWLARHIPPRLLGTLIGGLIMLSNAHVLTGAGPVPDTPTTRGVSYAVLGLVWAGALGWTIRTHRRRPGGPGAETAAGVSAPGPEPGHAPAS